MKPGSAVVVVAFVVAVALIVAAAFVLSTSNPCRGVDVEDFTDREITNLKARGWKGDPTDGREALYPPRCVEVEAQEYTGELTPGSGA